MNKLIIVTGASKGIGLALSKQLLSKGHRVIGTSREGIIQDIKNENFSAYKLDLSKQQSVLQFASDIESLNQKVDLLINNAGIGPDLYTEIPQATTFDSTFGVNVKGTVFLTEHLIKTIANKGHILNVSSKMGSIEHCQNFDSVAYRMSKSALNMYTQILSKRLDNITVAAIHPGWVKTTIANDKMEGRLTPKQSAQKIIDYIENNFKNGDFWDVESGTTLQW